MAHAWGRSTLQMLDANELVGGEGRLGHLSGAMALLHWSRPQQPTRVHALMVTFAARAAESMCLRDQSEEAETRRPPHGDWSSWAGPSPCSLAAGSDAWMQSALVALADYVVEMEQWTDQVRIFGSCAQLCRATWHVATGYVASPFCFIPVRSPSA